MDGIHHGIGIIGIYSSAKGLFSAIIGSYGIAEVAGAVQEWDGLQDILQIFQSKQNIDGVSSTTQRVTDSF